MVTSLEQRSDTIASLVNALRTIGVLEVPVVELQTQPMQTRGVAQMINVLNKARKNSRLYVRLISQDGVQFMLGPYGSGLTKAVAPITSARMPCWANHLDSRLGCP